jgi:hypothetical protein
MSVLSLFGQLAQAALPYDRYTAGDELRLDYKSDFLLSLLETVLPLIRSYFRYEGVSLENIRSSGRAMLD